MRWGERRRGSSGACGRFGLDPLYRHIYNDGMVAWIKGIFVFAFAVIVLAPAARAETINVGAASSLREAMEQIAAGYENQTKDHVELTFGSSGQLLAQIKGGAPIDAFISAADAQVKELIEAGLADESSRQVIAGNELVLIVRASAKEELKTFQDLTKVKRLSIGEPKTVPAGQYAMQALKALKLDETLRDRIVYGTNVRQVLDYLRRGEVPAGIVYATDAKEAGDEVKVVATAEGSWHEPIRYPAVIVKRSAKQEAAKKFLEYLRGEKAQAILKAKGFAAAEAEEGSAAGTTGK